MSRFFCFLLGIVLVTVMAVAQMDRGTITGTVTDASGAVIPAVRVTITNTETAIESQTETTATGQFTVPALPFGTYDLTFQAEGFQTLIQRGIALSATEVRRVDAEMIVGAVAESVEVTADLPRLATDTPEVATTLESRSMVDLPLIVSSGGRKAEDFAYKLVPGVSGDSYRGWMVGSTSFSKDSLLDGVTTTTSRAGHFGDGPISMEAVGEFKIQTSGVSAEHGRSQGVIFNYVMKSGTNEIHGSAFGSIRNEALNANTFPNNARGLPRSLDRLYTYAFSFGGPVFIPKVYDGKNKTFFYAAYEQYGEKKLATGAPSRTAPIPAFLEGDFSRLLQSGVAGKDALGNEVRNGAIFDPATFYQTPSGRWMGHMFPNNTIPASRFSSVARNINDILRKHYTPTVLDATGQIALENNMSVPGNNPKRDQWQYSTKVDHHFNQSHKIAGSIMYNYRPRLNITGRTLWDAAAEDGVGGPLATTRDLGLTSWFARLPWDWTMKPNILNHLSVFYNRFKSSNVNSHADTDGAAVYGLTGISSKGYPAINLTSGPYLNLGNLGLTQESKGVFNVWGALNTTSISHRNHFIKFGADWKHNLHVASSGPQPSLNFNPRATAIPKEPFAGNRTGFVFASYLLGIVDSASLADPVGRGYVMDSVGLFLQDDWKVTPRLTLNLGVRWEMTSPVWERHDRISSWSLDVIDPVSGLPGAMAFAGDCSDCTGKRHFGSYDLNNFAPRIGIAFRATDKMTLRTAYGIYYEGDSIGTSPITSKAGYSAWGGTYNLSSHPTDPWQGIFNWDNKFPTSEVYEPTSIDRSWGNRNTPSMYDPAYGTMPYVQKWNMNIQYELARNLVLDAGYLGTKGNQLRGGTIIALNQLDPQVLTTYGTNLTKNVKSAADAAKYGIPYPYEGFSGTVASALRPYPQVRGNSLVNVRGTPVGFSNTHSLQVTLDKRFSDGVTAYLNYVWSKSLSNVVSSVETEIKNRPLDYYNLALEKSLMDFDMPHMFKGFVSVELPFGRGKKWGADWHPVLDGVLGGWSVSSIINYFSGRPLQFSGSSTGLNWNGRAKRINIAPGEMVNSNFDKSSFDFFNTSGESNRYLNKDIFSNIEPGTLGTAAFNYAQARGFGTVNEDIGLQKGFTFKEKYRVQIRAELLNAFNRHSLGGPKTNVTSKLFGQITGVSGNRRIQAGMRLDF